MKLRDHERFVFMMKLLRADHRLERPNIELNCIYVFLIAVSLFLYIAFGEMVSFFYKNVMLIGCLLFLGSALKKDANPSVRKILGVSVAMVLWFLILQLKRNAEDVTSGGVELFLPSYLFALPFAFLVKDHRRRWLKFFAATYLVATVFMAVFSYMLILGCLPEALEEYVYWDGARLCAFRHPNIAACMFMIGVGFDLSFMLDTKVLWKKIFFAFLLVALLGAMAFTNSRTTILLTGGLLGVGLFLAFFKGKRRRILLGAIIVIAMILGVYAVLGGLYQKNHNNMLEKYTAQYQEQQAESGGEEFADGSEDEMEQEEIPINVNTETGDISLKVESGQGTLLHDVWTLNGRTITWKAAFRAIRETPAVLLWGTGDPGELISKYRADFEVSHAHNSWIESLMGLGLIGFAGVALITVFTVRNCLFTLWKCHADAWKRNAALLALCLMAAAFLEPYLFLVTMRFHPIDMAFMLCAGYLAFWQDKHCGERNDG